MELGGCIKIVSKVGHGGYIVLMPSIADIAAYMGRTTALDPCYATYAGIAGHDDELADLGADGFAGRAGPGRGHRGGSHGDPGRRSTSPTVMPAKLPELPSMMARPVTWE
jgi:hypothetical protein